MFGVTQIVAIDDSKDDLRALVRGLNLLGSACLGIHYSNVPGDMTIVPCPQVRVVITDLNLLGLPPGSNYRPLFRCRSHCTSSNPTSRTLSFGRLDEIG